MKKIKEIEITTSIIKINRIFNIKNVRNSSIILINVLSIRIKTIKVLKETIKVIYEIIVIIIIIFENIIVKKNKLE